jgi:hypothetical protein
LAVAPEAALSERNGTHYSFESTRDVRASRHFLLKSRHDDDEKTQYVDVLTPNNDVSPQVIDVLTHSFLVFPHSVVVWWKNVDVFSQCDRVLPLSAFVSPHFELESTPDAVVLCRDALETAPDGLSEALGGQEVTQNVDVMTQFEAALRKSLVARWRFLIVSSSFVIDERHSPFTTPKRSNDCSLRSLPCRRARVVEHRRARSGAACDMGCMSAMLDAGPQ